MDLSCIWNFEYDNNKNSLESRVHRNDQTYCMWHAFWMKEIMPNWKDFLSTNGMQEPKKRKSKKSVEKSLTTDFYCITAEKRKNRKINQKSKNRQKKLILQPIWLFWTRFFSVSAFRCIQRTHCDHGKLDLSAEKTLSKDWPVHRYLIKPPSFDFLIPGLVQSQSPGVIWMRSRKLLIIKSYEQEN